MSNIEVFLKSKQQTKVQVEEQEIIRFMLQLDVQTRDMLRDMCAELGCKQISFASELFTMALQDAHATFQAGKAAKK